MYYVRTYIPPHAVPSAKEASDANCVDLPEYYDMCPSWQASGSCENNAASMLATCRESCGDCPYQKKGRCCVA